MLKVPQKVDHGLMLMRHLAANYAAKLPLSLEDVAKKEGVSQGYLEEVARLLRAAKLVEGRRGIGGGYVLAKNPAEITVANVVTALEGKTWTPECIGETPKRRVSANDALWRRVQGQVMATLHAMTIAEVAAEDSRLRSNKN